MGLSQSNPDGGRSDTRTQDEREEEKKEIKNKKGDDNSISDGIEANMPRTGISLQSFGWKERQQRIAERERERERKSVHHTMQL